jgi:signal transduction histidine kinase
MGGQVVVSAGLSVTGEVCVVVKDTGIGVSAEDLQRIFEPFVQVEGPYNRRHQGTGLGLSLVRAMAEQHHARLELESEVGQGTTARICFPRDRVIQSYADEPSLVRIA